MSTSRSRSMRWYARCGSRSSTTTRCSGWAWPRRSTRWTASSSSARPSGPTRWPASWPRSAPDVVLLDVRLADGSGLEVNRWLAEHHPEVRVIMLTMSEDHDTALTALRDGASGYLVKGAGPERVEHALRAVAGRRRRARPGARPGRHRAGPGPAARAGPPVPAAHRPRVRHPRARRRGPRQPRPSPAGSCSARRPCATTCPTCSPRSRPPTARSAIVLARRLGLGS